MRDSSRSEVRFGERLTRAGQVGRSLVTSGLGIAWVTVFLLVPLLAILVISFLTVGEESPAEGPLTLENYKRFVGFGAFGFDPLYPLIIVRSLVMGAGTAGLCVMAALPLAFFVAGLPARHKNLALTLVIIPFWTNLLIRTYAWQILFAPGSFLAELGASWGLVEPGQALYPSMMAVYVGMVCDYLPFLVLPLYSSVEKIDWSLVEAAADLGADRWRTFWHAILPQVMPGLVAGIILVFIPATGQFVIPDLLGGGKVDMLGNLISRQFGASRDWPFGSAVAILGMTIVLVGLWVYARQARKGGGETII